MKSLHTKQDVIDLAAEHAPTRACQRRLEEYGSCTVWRVPTLPGWIVCVWDLKSSTKVHLIGIEVDEANRCYGFTYPDRVPTDAIEVKGNRL